MCGTTTDATLISKYKQSLKVSLFDDLQGVNPQLITLLNEKIRVVKKDCEVQLANKDHLIEDLEAKIKQYQAVAPNASFLVDLPLEELCESMTQVYTQSYPVLSCLIQAYPENHFNFAMQEALKGDSILDSEMRH